MIRKLNEKVILAYENKKNRIQLKYCRKHAVYNKYEVRMLIQKNYSNILRLALLINIEKVPLCGIMQ